MIKRFTRKILRSAIFLVLFSLTIVIIAALYLQFFVLPNIDSYKDKIAAYASKAAGKKITIGQIKANWDGVNPHLDLANIDIFDAKNRSALNFKHIESNVSWLSIPLLQARLSMLKVHSPELTIRREANGKLFVAGMDMSEKSSPEFSNWLLEQKNVDVLDAKVIWQDDFRRAPELSLNQLNFHLHNPTIQSRISQHQFTFSAKPSIGTNTPILISGHFYGHDVSKVEKWHGQIVASLKNTDLSVWKQWLDYPFDLQSGFGSAKLSLDFSDARIEKAVSDVALMNVVTKLHANSEAITFQHLSGQLSAETTADEQVFAGENLKLVTTNGLDIQKGDVHVRTKKIKNKTLFDAELKLDAIQLEMLNKIAPYFPLPSALLTPLNNLAPTGNLRGLNLHWIGDEEKSTEYSIKTAFEDLSIQPYEKIPGFTNFTGDISATKKGGQVHFNTKNAVLNLKQILRLPVPINQLAGDLSWKVSGNKTVFNTKDLAVSNPHLAGTIDADYEMNGINGGHLDLHGKFGKGNAKYAYYYYPVSLGTDTLHWLDTSILEGHAENIDLKVKGNLADFPYVDKSHHADKSLGIFKVTAKLSDIKLEFGTGWPEIEGLGLDMLFEGTRMQLNANKGHIFGNEIISSVVEIPVLDADSPMLNVVSEVQGSVTDGIKFVNKSPVKDVTQGFTDDLKTLGNSKLHLELNIPMQDIEHAKYKGTYQIINGTIAADAALGLPELSKINGKLNFTESNLQATNISTWVYGDATQFSLNTDKDKTIHVTARGHATDVALKQALGAGLADRVSGSTDWAGEITIKKPFVDLALRSNLVGLALDLPAPFNKAANEQSILRIDKKQLSASSSSLNVGFANVLNAKILLANNNGATAIDRGEIGINTTATLPAQKGLSVRGTLDYLDADAWREVLNTTTSKASHDKSLATPNINKADFNIKALDIFDRRLNAITASMKPTTDGWKGSLQSKEINGNIQWISTDNGKIIARLKDLIVPTTTDSVQSNKMATPTNSSKKDFKKLVQRYPALDIIADNFEIGQKKLGRLELIAFENKDDWNIQKLKISNEDSTLTADGDWHNWTRNPNTKLNFEWDVARVDKTLKRFGQPDTVKGGSANLRGRLSWAGSPHEFETNGLNGNFTLKASKGQIVKVQPGVGRLLGLLSLQSLPRRLTLDFRDLFSSGFAYDQISATAKVDNGILRSDDFYMTGPAAEVTIKGETNLQKETQHLNIKVIPHVSDSLSLAAFAGGPIAGIVAFVAQKILKDPLNKISSTEYQITGTWDNPQEVGGDKANATDHTEKPIIESAPSQLN